MCIYEQADWPHFRWNAEKLLPLLGNVRNRQGRLIGKMESLGFELQSEVVLQMLTLDVVKSSVLNCSPA
jgi:NOL1/NOP2/fmu family ribosome biogenesis protein